MEATHPLTELAWGKRPLRSLPAVVPVRVPTFDDWSKAMEHAGLLAAGSGLRHRVARVPATSSWPWGRWRIEPLAEETPAAGAERRALHLLADPDADVLLTPPCRGQASE